MDSSMLTSFEEMRSKQRRGSRRKVGVMAVGAMFAVSALAILPAMSKAATKPETDQVGCVGTSGYDSTGTWNFEQLGLLSGNACKIYSPDNFKASVAKPPAPGVPSLVPPALCNPPTSPGNLLCNVFTLVNAICGLEPADCSWLVNTVLGTAGGAAFSTFANVTMSGTGNLQCGNGTLSGTGRDGNGPEPDFNLTWTAVFKNYVGKVTGTAVSDGSPTDDPSDAAGAVKKLTGTIALFDGAQVNTPLGIGIGDCSDFAAGQNPTLIHLTYTG